MISFNSQNKFHNLGGCVKPKNMRLGEGKQVAQRHTVSKWEIRFKSRASGSKFTFFPVNLCFLIQQPLATCGQYALETWPRHSAKGVLILFNLKNKNNTKYFPSKHNLIKIKINTS